MPQANMKMAAVRKIPMRNPPRRTIRRMVQARGAMRPATTTFRIHMMPGPSSGNAQVIAAERG
jgi:hypothetical protein